ncbi:MAG: flavin reductase [Clostridia bacterium]|nr:flavin reductase [Clostridia bacterium]
MHDHFEWMKSNDLTDNVFSLIGHDWMLVTSGTPEHYNTMTASWGGMGVLWNKNVCFVFVRPTRYTYEFMEKNDTFSLSFFTPEWKKALNVCGTKSGRDIDKAKETGLVAFAGQNKTTGFEQARLVIECKKLYFQDLNPENFLDKSIDAAMYALKDYHRMYVGEILTCAMAKDK